jgi:hypothetical protein
MRNRKDAREGDRHVDDCSLFVPVRLMGLIKLATITDLARRGYDAKITCAGYGQVSHWTAIELADELSRRRKPLRIEAVEPIMRCRACGKRGAVIQPVEQF